jgi:hypothetical protein
MEQSIELRRAVLREEIKITRKLLLLGYYPYKIKFDGYGHVEIEMRQSDDSDQERLNEKVKELSSIDATLSVRSRK